MKSNSTSNAEERVRSGQVWSDFCDELKKAGEVILRDRSPDDPLDRAEGWRYLSRLTRLALEQSVEHNDPAAPTFYRLSHETAKIGADNPDAYYQNAIIDGSHDYRISGTRGAVQYLGMGTYSGVYGLDEKIEETGFLDVAALDVAAMEVGEDDRLEVVLSKDPKPGNWLPMREDTRLLIIRQFRQDWETETIAELEIECLTGDNKPSLLSPDKIADGLDGAARFVRATASIFAGWAEDFSDNPNDVQQKFTGLGDPNNQFWHGYWTLNEGEALVIEAMPPECEAWNFQLNNYWEESLDYRYFNVHINKHTARYEDDGSLLIVVAPKDPGIGNWIDTVGHRHGTLGLRWTKAVDPKKPSLRVVPLAQLKERTSAGS
jgi:hypothetical protein